MTIELAEFWGQLEDSVHPDDKRVLEEDQNHAFNLDFPPPAFIGDIVNARVIILDNNGGFSPSLTPTEFPDEEACQEYRDRLANPVAVDPSARSMARYYVTRNFSDWLISGEAALVNGVAYRSKDGSAKGIARLTRTLPSAVYHQRWLREILAPLVREGERFVVAHRWSRWNNAADSLRNLPNVIFSEAPISKDLTAREREAAERFLEGC